MKIVKHYIVCLFALFTFSGIAQNAKESELVRNKQRVNYIFNIANYIEWENSSDDFIIGVLGQFEESLIAEFVTKAKTNNIKEKPVQVKYFTSITDVKKVNILYVHNRNKIDINKLLNIAYNNSTLIVSENYPFHTSMINFIELGNDLHFEMSEEKISKAGLMFDPDLSSFSIQKMTEWEELFELVKKEKDVIIEQKNELESLNNEINDKNTQLENKTTQLDEQSRQIIEQNTLLNAQTDSLQKKKVAIQQQKLALQNLISNIGSKNDSLLAIKKILDNQESSIDSQQQLIDNQNKLYKKQKQNIQNQYKIIETQDSKINKQLNKLKGQKIVIIYIVVLLMLFLLLAFYAFKNYRKQQQIDAILKDRNKKILAFNKSLDGFVNRVAHDLKTPVINVQNMVLMLKSKINIEKESIVDQIVRNMELSSNKLEDTIEDLLTLVRIERINDKRVAISLEAVFLQLIEHIQHKIEISNTTIHHNFDNNNIVKSSHSEITGIFQNMILNSIKYKKDNEDPVIHITTKSEGDKLILEYSDNGEGIDLDRHKKKLFKIFQRFSDNNKVKGTGVGMYIIHKLVENSGGVIHLESELGKGLKYIIEFNTKE